MGLDAQETVGLLPEDVTAGDLPTVLDAVLDVCASSRSGRSVRYQYSVGVGDDSERGTSASRRELDRLFSTYGYGSLELWYGDLDLLLFLDADDGCGEDHYPEGPHVLAAVDPVYFGKDPDFFDVPLAGRVELLLDFWTELYDRLDLRYVYGYPPGLDYHQYITPPRREALADGVLEQVYWLNVLPPHVVERLGRDAVLDAPAWLVEPLDDGAVRIATAEGPPYKTDAGASPDAVAEHLGI